MNWTPRSHLDLYWDPYTVQQTQNNLSQQLNCEEVEFAKIKQFGSMRIRPGYEELGRDFLCSDSSKKDELRAKKSSIVYMGKTTPYQFYQVLQGTSTFKNGKKSEIGKE